MDCSNCGKCCTECFHLSLYKSDIDRIKTKIADFEVKYKQNLKIIKKGAFPYYMLLMTEKGCIFFDHESKKCSIYEIRPNICRVFPIIFRGFDFFESFKPISQRRFTSDNFNIALCNAKQLFTITLEDINAMINLSVDKCQEQEECESKLTNVETNKVNQFKESEFPKFPCEKEFPLGIFLQEQLNPQFQRFILLLQSYFVDHATQIEEYNKFENWFGSNLMANPKNHAKVISDAVVLLEGYMKEKGQKIP